MDALHQLNVRCERIPVLPGLNRYTLSRFLMRLLGLISSVKQHRPDLIHANTNFTSLYSGIIAKFLKIPAIGHIRDIEPLGRMGRWTIRQNRQVLAISQAVKNYLLGEHFAEDHIICAFDGVDLQKYRFQPESVDSSSTSPIIIGIVGQIGERKGHVYLLHAIPPIIQLYPGIKIWIVGKEPQSSTEGYTEQVRLYVKDAHLDQYVRFWGFRKDIPDILAQLDILVLPSLQEPFGKIVVEAMAMGKPVVASRVGGVPEIVVDGETGILVPPKNATAIQKALEQLIVNSEKRKQMGVAGRKRVEQHFSIKKTVRKTEQIYEEILSLDYS